MIDILTVSANASVVHKSSRYRAISASNICFWPVPARFNTVAVADGLDRLRVDELRPAGGHLADEPCGGHRGRVTRRKIEWLASLAPESCSVEAIAEGAEGCVKSLLSRLLDDGPHPVARS
jgi:hypothetical protein